MNICHIGLGRQGGRLLERLTDRGHHTEVAAPNSRSKFERFQSYMSDPFWDAVVIACPDEHHEVYAREACLGGKHVFVEKPVGSSLNETIRILRYAEDAGVGFGTGYTFLWHPIFQELLDKDLDNWHFRWTKPTKSRTLDRTLMSHHIALGVMAWGSPIYHSIIQTSDRCLGQFIFEGGKTLTSNIRVDEHVIHEAEVRQRTGTCTFNLQCYGDPDPVDNMLTHWEQTCKHPGLKFAKRMHMKDLALIVARILDGQR